MHPFLEGQEDVKRHIRKSKQDLLDALKTHFPEYPLPKDDEIFGYAPYGPEAGFDLEVRGYYDAYRGRPWTWITPERVSGMYSSIWFLGPIGFKYYLPGFLTYALLSDFDEGEMVVHSVAAVLRPSEMYTPEELAKKMSHYDYIQLNIILAYVRFAAPKLLSGNHWHFEEDVEAAIAFWSALTDQAR